MTRKPVGPVDETVNTAMPPSSKPARAATPGFEETLVVSESGSKTPNPDVVAIRPARASRPSIDPHRPSAAVSPTDKPRGSVPPLLGRYRVRRLLGQGGVGAVYESEDPELGRKVAIKILREDRDGDTEGLKKEAQALARLVHPNVVAVYDVGVADHDVFVVMQLVDGETIDRWFQHAPADAAAVIAKYRQAGEGLAAAHAAGLVHCDFKPGNVLVDREGGVRVTDFGLARALRGNAGEPGADASLVLIAGTPAYMAPEQFEGVVTAASDQFAFCIAVWEQLAGERPFDDPSIAIPDAERVRARARKDDDKIPPAVRAILERGLSPLPEERYPSMRALLSALDAAMAPPARSHTRAIAIGAAIVVAAVGSVVIATRRPQRPGPQQNSDSGSGSGSQGAAVAPAAPWDGANLAAQVQLTTYGEAACAYAPTLEGDQIVFDYSADDQADLFTVPLAGGTPKQLTAAPTREWRPAQGRKLGEVVTLVHPADDAGPPARIAYVDTTTGAMTTAATVLAYGAIASPDALFYAPDQPPSIHVLRGGADRELAALKDRDYYQLALSPDSTQLAVASTDSSSLCVMSTTTGNPDCFATDGSDARPAFSADGTAIYYGGHGGIHRHVIATGVDSLIAPETYAWGGMAVTPSGDRLVYSTCVNNAPLVDLTTKQVIVPDTMAVWSSQAAMAKDGSLTWIRTDAVASILMLRTADGIAELTKADLGEAATPSFSQDSRRIAFRVEGKGIFVVDRDSPGTIEQVSDDPLDSNPYWTADGMVAFARHDSSGNRHPYVGTADGSAKPHAIAALTRFLFGSNGKELLVGTMRALYWLDPTTGTERPGPKSPPGYLLSVGVSPSGTWLVFQLRSDGQELWRAKSGGPLEHVITYPTAYTVSIASITDEGHIIASPGHWAGDLYSIPAKPGYKF